MAVSLLFFGCRNPEADYLYADELRRVSNQGIVSVVTAFSRIRRDNLGNTSRTRSCSR